jgi:hypothetical protein
MRAYCAVAILLFIAASTASTLSLVSMSQTHLSSGPAVAEVDLLVR